MELRVGSGQSDGGIADSCAGREDDKKDVILRRFKSYKDDTMPVVERLVTSPNVYKWHEPRFLPTC